jgi:hypothetical protein
MQHQGLNKLKLEVSGKHSWKDKQSLYTPISKRLKPMEVCSQGMGGIAAICALYSRLQKAQFKLTTQAKPFW